MPEIKLGSSANMKNINLGVIELQEVYLGNILVWQNNLGPAYATLIWDGTTFTLPSRVSGEPMEKFTRAFTSGAGDGGGARTITLSLRTISDPDNEREPGTNDFLVGYRLQRPDGTYAAGDPSSSGNNSFGAPIKGFGASLPNATAVWNSVDEIFTSGDTTLVESNISVALRETDPSGNVVDSTTQTFVDAGDWKIIVIDSRGGESTVGTLEITLIYDDPSGGQVNSITQGGQSAGSAISTNSSSPTSYTNATLGGPTSAVLAFNNTGGPISTNPLAQYSWSCMSGCSGNSTDPTFQVSIPQAAGGTATPARVRLTVTGRAYNGNTAGTTTVSDVYFRSGPSVTGPSIGYTGDSGACDAGSSIQFVARASSTNTSVPGYSFVSWGGGGSPQTINGTCPACDVTTTISGTAISENLTINGTPFTTSASGVGRSFTGGRSAYTRCTASPGGAFSSQDIANSSFIACSASRPHIMNGSFSFEYRTISPTACGNSANATTACRTYFTANCNDTAGGADAQVITATGISGTPPPTTSGPTSSGGTATFGCNGSNVRMESATATMGWSGSGRGGSIVMRCTVANYATDCDVPIQTVNGTSASKGSLPNGTHSLNINDGAMTIVAQGSGVDWSSCNITCTYYIPAWESSNAHSFTQTVSNCP